MTRKWKQRLKWLVFALLLVVLALAAIVETGLDERWARRAIVAQLEKLTGGQVELRAFRFRWFDLRAELDDLTIHGSEPEGTPPFFHADHLLVDVRVDSLFRRKISLDEVQLDRPAVHVRIDAEGQSNVPKPKTARPPGKPWRERIFDVKIRQFRLNDGEFLFNNTRVPLAAEGDELNFALDYVSDAQNREAYRGQLTWQGMRLAARRYLPFASDIAAKFQLTREGFTLEEFRWKLPHTEISAAAKLASFTQPDWIFHYDGRLDLADLQHILRKPNSPGGQVKFSGDGRYAQGNVSVRGSYDARNIAMPYKWFHAGGIDSQGSYRVENRRLEVPDFRARALGGQMTGRVELDFSGIKFKVTSQMRGASLAAVLAAVNNESFPLDTLHWDGLVDVDAVTAWERDFKSVDSRGTSRWAPPLEPQAGKIPATARLDYHYVMDQSSVELRDSEITTPSSHIAMNGLLGARDSALAVDVDVQDLVPWDDFINRLRGADAVPRLIAGRAKWQGRMTGRLDGPTFAGHVRASQAVYDDLKWDELEGEVTYSPDELRLARMRARRGETSASLELRLELDDWAFHPESAWSFDATAERAPTDGLQSLFGTAYPVRGLLSGQFHGRGTRADPEFSGLFDIAEPEAWGWRADRFHGRLDARRDEVRIANAEIRIGAGRVTGNFLYRLPGGEIEYDLTGAGLLLESIERLQTKGLPLAGQLSFQLSGGGTLRAPSGQGTARLVDLVVGQDKFGSFDAKLRSDGRRLHAELGPPTPDSASTLRGNLDLDFGGDFNVNGDLAVKNLDMDALIIAALRLEGLTGHSSVTGNLKFSGALRKPETIAVEANLQQLRLDYQYVNLENDGPVEFHYRRDEVRIGQARLRGADTDLTLGGFARFTGDRPLGLNLTGTVNLRLLAGLLPDLVARGAAQVNANVEGTMDRPRITGALHVENASANYGDFPTGLSRVRGDFVFDRSRMVFENVSAEAGGGQLLVSGSLTYGDGPVRYDLTGRATRIRVRYPEGMSWLAGGTLRLAGTTTAAVLSGRVSVERLFMAEGFDLVGMFGRPGGAAGPPATASAYLRNLQFDIEANSTPDARLEWAAARFDTDASVRLRGTWEHPILLGHIRLLSGDVNFRGNRYRLSRGDINFSKPFEINPDLNVEATTTIRQYEVTLNLAGPANHPVLTYRSDPPLPATDIVALLALGRTGEESELRTAGQRQAPELGATTLLSEAISSQLGGRIERLFGVSRFRVDPFLAGTGSEQNASARITVEQQVARDLVITYITNVTSTEQQVIQVEYSVTRDISIIALRDQNGTFGLDIKFKKRFK